MRAVDLIGAVGAAALHVRLEGAAATPDAGVARFILDRLTAEQVAAICSAVLKNQHDADRTAMFIPREFVSAFDLPDHVLTDRRTVAHRHADCDRPAMLLVNTDDDQGASLGDVTFLGSKELTADPNLWVEAAAAELGLPDRQRELWQVALRGMLSAGEWSLLQVADYVADTRKANAVDSRPILDALGWALPALHLPRDSAFFSAMREKDQLAKAKWKGLFQKLLTQRQPLLRKHKPSRQLIETEELVRMFEGVKDQIPAAHHPTIQAFIFAPPAWTQEARALADLEWEKDGVLQLFSGLRTTKTSLPAETSNYFEFELPDVLSPEDKEYLAELEKRKSLKEAREDDVEFYEKHREELGKDRALKAKWDQFIYGKPIESTDFLAALLGALERLYEQTGSFAGPKRLTIRTQKRSKADWLALNADVGTYFCLRYRGLQDLTGPNVTWDVGHLFRFEDLLREAAEKRKKKFTRTTSAARNAVQIKFELELEVGAGANSRNVGCQVIWQGQPGALGMELHEDLERLIRKPFIRSSVNRKSVSRKGLHQSVSLRDASSLEPAYDKDSGSLVPKHGAALDIAEPFKQALRSGRAEERITAEGETAIQKAWEAFAEKYLRALKEWRGTGISGTVLLEQAESYGELLETLLKFARGDLNRGGLIHPVLELGLVRVEEGPPAAIVAPWHPLRMAAFAAKARSVGGLLRHVLGSDEVNFGDTRLFFSDLRAELSHPYYPEVVPGGDDASLLSTSDSLNEYSLMERPVQDASTGTTSEDASDAAKRVRDVIGRYLQLQPHENANLSVALYDCDSAGLPIAAVAELAALQEEEIHCNVVLRHQDQRKLGTIFSEMLERSDADPDAVVASETSRNFMSKLRIGIRLDGAPMGSPTGPKEIDVAFLQDVVSRRARETWISQPESSDSARLLEHVPPRWSYKRSGVEEELKSTSYLACPRQPRAGWAYLDALAAVVTRGQGTPGEHRIPARQIDFKDSAVRAVFDEVHNLAEWVVNYDDLLDKRQLLSQRVNVIRYQRRRTNGRNLVISSTSELRVLQVLVRRRLDELALGLDDARLVALTRRLIEDATEVSGDIVLRAAKRGVFAGELIGLVLSRALVADELGEIPTAWFFLDDYATWLGQKEEGIADLLALSVLEENGDLVLRAVVTEAKYVTGSAVAEERRTSRRQLQDTVRRMNDALFGDPGRLDRDLWLARLSDLLLDAIRGIGSARMFDTLRDRVRAGTARIDLRGYSHVFVSAPADGGPADEQEPVVDVPHGLQEVFSRATVRDLLLAYEANQPLAKLRQRLGDEQPWTKVDFRLPSARVQWIAAGAPSRKSGTAGQSSAGPGSGAAANPAHSPPTQSGTTPTAVTPAASLQGVTDGSARTPDSNVETMPERAGTPISNVETIPERAGTAAPPPIGMGRSLTTLLGSRVTPVEGTAAADSWLEQSTSVLRTALLGYGLQAKVTGSRLTPNAVLIRLRGSDRLGVDDIESRRSALLTTHGLRIISVSARPGEVVVAIERPARSIVSLWDVWSRRAVNRGASGLNLSLVVGVRELDGELLYLNLGSPFLGAQQHEPHTLIAGTTGSGKSVLLQNLLLDIGATNPSRLAQVHLIDPKMGVDYAAIEHLPHIKGGIVTKQSDALAVLNSMVDEMERRYEKFKGVGRDLQAFNAKVAPQDRLPVMFVVHDEFADWMMTEDYREAVTSLVGRLGAKARGAGIHLIFAAQRPEATVMPMQLRSNLGNRLVLRVSDVGTSEIALNAKGAERLLGKGHLAARLAGEADLVFAQVPFLSDDDMLAAVEAIRADDSP